MNSLPKIVSALVHTCEAWIVGGAARPIPESCPRDWDVIVPHSHWHIAAQHIPPIAVPNSFGGWKIKGMDTVIDVWPGDMAWLMQQDKATCLWKPDKGIRWVKDGSR